MGMGGMAPGVNPQQQSWGSPDGAAASQATGVNAEQMQRFLQSSITRNAFGLNGNINGSGPVQPQAQQQQQVAMQGGSAAAAALPASAAPAQEGESTAVNGILGAVAGVVGVAGVAVAATAGMYYQQVGRDIDAAESQLSGLLDKYKTAQSSIASIKGNLTANQQKQKELESASQQLREVFQKLVKAREAYDQFAGRSAIDEQWVKVAKAMKVAQDYVAQAEDPISEMQQQQLREVYQKLVKARSTYDQIADRAAIDEEWMRVAKAMKEAQDSVQSLVMRADKAADQLLASETNISSLEKEIADARKKVAIAQAKAAPKEALAEAFKKFSFGK